MSHRRVAIGIDLGTTYSCVAVFRNGRVDVIANDQGHRITPSCVAFTNEEKLIGESAKAQAATNHMNTIYEVKRIIGRTADDENLQKDIQQWPFKVINAGGVPKVKVTYNNVEKLLTAEEVSAMVLTEMKKIAEINLGSKVCDAVITVPAYFNDAQRQATKDAGKIAGLNVLSIINEPTAAAIAYGIDKNVKSSRNILIFDLGGGTFDVVILTISNGNYEVKAVGGDTHLGGSDFDNRLVKHFQDVIHRKHGKDISTNMRATGRLKKACENAKRSLSSALKTNIAVDGLFDGVDFISSLTRNRFEDLCGDLFQNTLEHVKAVISDASITKSDIGEVVLVGGSTRIPKIRELLEVYFAGKKLNQTINPDEAVAYGAAVKAALMSGEHSMREISLVDVIPMSLGLENYGGAMVTSIKRNTAVPIRHEAEWTTPVDYMSQAVFKVFEGEKSIAAQNHLLGNFTLNNIELAQRGIPKFGVTFIVDSDGILSVTAIDKKTKSKKNIVITTNKGRLSDTDISRMMTEIKLDENENDPHAQQKAENARELFESHCFSQKLLIDTRSVHDTLTERDRKKVLQWLVDAIDWVDDHPNLQEKDYTLKMKQLKVKCAPFMKQLKS